MKKITKHLLSLVFVLSLVIIPTAASFAAITADDLGAGPSGDIAANIKLGNTSPLKTATNLINTAMMFLGIIAVAIILLGGFKWMTAGGGEEKITEAKKLMSAGVIGIIIILSAWGIANFILGKAIEVTK